MLCFDQVEPLMNFEYRMHVWCREDPSLVFVSSTDSRPSPVPTEKPVGSLQDLCTISDLRAPESGLVVEMWQQGWLPCTHHRDEVIPRKTQDKSAVSDESLCHLACFHDCSSFSLFHALAFWWKQNKTTAGLPWNFYHYFLQQPFLCHKNSDVPKCHCADWFPVLAGVSDTDCIQWPH